jgi:hypothetical protein
MQQFDMVRVFKHIARLAGAKNVDNFEVKVKPDQEVMRQVQAGNLIPAQGGGQVSGQGTAAGQ